MSTAGAARKEIRKYWFTVEGNNESWYLGWLEKRINKHPGSKYRVIFPCSVQQNPLKFSKTVNVLSVPEVTHWCDVESDEYVHVRRFQDVLQQMRKSTGLGGRKFRYLLGYSNFTFELWMVLHKLSLYETLGTRFDYLEPINTAYGENYTRLENYKSERNFKRILGSLTLDDVADAIGRAKEITAMNREENFRRESCCGYRYYTENPSLSIWESVEKILNDCRITGEPRGENL